MKKIFVLCALLSLPAFAASVKVTSFHWIRSGEPLAEICGLVEGATDPVTHVRVVVDHRSTRPGVYNATAGADGKFCLAVITFRGTAETSIFGATSGTQSHIRQ